MLGGDEYFDENFSHEIERSDSNAELGISFSNENTEQILLRQIIKMILNNTTKNWLIEFIKTFSWNKYAIYV